MRIGIIGTGKMGIEILNLFSRLEVPIIILGHSEESIKKQEQKVRKRWARSYKVGLITKEQYERQMEEIVFTSSVEKLKDCTLVIESIVEDCIAKRNIFKEVDSVVSKECILATNTSSLPLDEIFAECHDKSRCLSIHFFYPVQVTNYVELNVTKQVSIPLLKKVEDVLKQFQMKFIVLHEGNHFLINQILSIVISGAFNICQAKKIHWVEMDELIKKHFMMYGAFELADSIGFPIIKQSIDVYEKLDNGKSFEFYQPFKEFITQRMEEGGDGSNTAGFYSCAEEPPLTTKLSLQEEMEIVDSLHKLIWDEIEYHVQNYRLDRNELEQGLVEVFAFSAGKND